MELNCLKFLSKSKFHVSSHGINLNERRKGDNIVVLFYENILLLLSVSVFLSASFTIKFLLSNIFILFHLFVLHIIIFPFVNCHNPHHSDEAKK